MIKRFKQPRIFKITSQALPGRFAKPVKGACLKPNHLKLVRLLAGLGLLIILECPFSFGKLAVANAEQSTWHLQLWDEQHKPLTAVECEILSYDWGRPPGQPYAVIAKGQTNQAGQVDFEVSRWPRSGYLFRLSLPHLQASSSLGQPHQAELETTNIEQEQPGGIWLTLGGQSEHLTLVLGPHGQLYLDKSTNKTKGEISEATEAGAGGPAQPHTTPVPQATFLGQTASDLSARGSSKLVVYPLPVFAVTPTGVQTALTAGEAAVTNSAGSSGAKTQALENQSDLGENLLLALFGLISLGLFWKFRLKLYRWLGLNITNNTTKTKPAKVITKKPYQTGARVKLVTKSEVGGTATQTSQAENRTVSGQPQQRETEIDQN
jgi:hypothetical protein